ncbi:MAG: glycoside hydrolase family 32 protein [Planctomycetota bacterium]
MKHRLLIVVVVVGAMLSGRASVGGDAPGGAPADAARKDILIADFEGQTYGEGWTVEGEAFGPGPARGTLPGQMNVSGFQGKGLVNTYFKGDGTTGTLTSPPFTVERKYINFLIGGGGFAGTTCMNLLVDGKVVRTAAGSNAAGGGSEALAWQTWDVSKLAGREATIQIVDRRTGGWGHINVDQIEQSDTKKGLPLALLVRVLKIDKRYLLLPVRNGAPTRVMTIDIDPPPPAGSHPARDKRAHIFNIPLAERDPDWWAFLDLSEYEGRTATIHVNTMARGTHGMAALELSDTIRNLQPLYDEVLRPQLRFSQKRGWNNDPNGMVYYDGEYHFSWQSNPFGLPWANMYWGHAVSKDLVHWEELKPALRPWAMARAHCFSGSAAVDVHNTGGFQTGKEKVIVAAFTDTGCGESIAYSNDRGRTFTYYKGNPIIRHGGRDPKLIWYTPPGGDKGWWVIAVYDGSHGGSIAFYTSTDLKTWNVQSYLPGYYECAEIFELPVLGGDGKPTGETRWVAFAADARYAVGRFDGKKFTPDHKGKHGVHWGAYYASQTFTQAPGNRRVQIGWARIGMPGMPFNQAFTVPTELTLRETDDGIRMFAEPIRELDGLHGKKHTFQAGALNDGAPATLAVKGQLFDIRVAFEPGTAASVELAFGPTRVTYDAKRHVLNGMPLKPVNGRIYVRVLVDRPMVEICGNHGRVYRTDARPGAGKEISAIQLTARGGAATLVEGVVYEMKSIWRTER